MDGSDTQMSELSVLSVLKSNQTIWTLCVNYLEALDNWIIFFCSFWYIYHNNSREKNKDIFLKKNTNIWDLVLNWGVECISTPQNFSDKNLTYFDVKESCFHIQGTKQQGVGGPVWNKFEKSTFKTLKCF